MATGIPTGALCYSPAMRITVWAGMREGSAVHDFEHPSRTPILFDRRGIVPAIDAVAATFHDRGVGRRPRSPVAVEAR